MSIPASYLLKKIGFKKGMMIGFWCMSVGAFVFIPAAYTRTYEIFLVGLFTIGIGLSILQTAANPYITILGPKESAASTHQHHGYIQQRGRHRCPITFCSCDFKSNGY